jgi:hypothetical protein
MIRRVPWDGPNPAPGEFLAGKGRSYFRIRSVVPLVRPSPDGARLSLDLLRQGASDLPDGAVVHPLSRYAASDPAGPPRIRQITDGPAGVMRDRWRDPSDTRPTAAARPRLVTGYRSSCPLRRMAAAKKSHITDIHIVAADHFRTMYDLAYLGYTMTADGVKVAAGYGPRPGPSQAAHAQSAARGSVQRALARFAPPQTAMLTAIVLQNSSLYAWCAEGRLNASVEMGKLIAILDILADHYDREVDALMQTDAALVLERA